VSLGCIMVSLVAWPMTFRLLFLTGASPELKTKTLPSLLLMYDPAGRGISFSSQ